MNGAWLECTSTVIHLLCAALVATQVSFTPRPLSAFQRDKAEALLRNRLPCLGCHELGSEGGRIAPSLSGPWAPDHVYNMIRDPQRMVPGTIMPRVAMPQATLELITNYLVQRAPSPRRAPAVSIPAPDPARASDSAALYARLCAACHGRTGGGDGDNARYLPVRPTAHADSQYMSRRPDDALFDAIYAGGFIMNRSNRMPPFGGSLTRDQVWGLVRYLRTLCRCAGPAWSRDNQ
jgi:mono/diheme cytochrome c family protein